MFKNPKALAAIYPVLVNHAMHHFKSPDVMRFLGRKATGNYTGEFTPADKLAGREQASWSERDRKLADAREMRRQRRAKARNAA